jgi:UDP-glucose 4-epimerase
MPPDVDLAIHLAANARVFNLVVDPSLANENFAMLFNVMEWCRKNKTNRIIFASSREVYGNTGRMLHAEDDVAIKNCESPYTASKMSGEALIHAYAKCYGIDFIINRFSNVYGMYDDSDRVVPLFIKLTKENKDTMVYGEDKILDFTYIDDAVAGIIKEIENFDSVKNNTLNIATGSGVKIIDVAKMIIAELNGKNKIIIQNNRTGEVVKYVADISLAKKVLGFKPEVGIEEGLKRSVLWYGSR